MSGRGYRSVSSREARFSVAGDVLRAATGVLEDGAIAFLSAPQSFRLLRFSEGRWTASSGLDTIELDLSGAEALAGFEVRAFDSVREWRWRRDPAGSAVIEIGESDEGPGAEVLNTRGYGRLVIGTPTGERSRDGAWLLAADGAVGTLSIPVSEPLDGEHALTGGRLELTAVEYVDENTSGSVTVVGERLTGIRWVPDENGGSAS